MSGFFKINANNNFTNCQACCQTSCQCNQLCNQMCNQNQGCNKCNRNTIFTDFDPFKVQNQPLVVDPATIATSFLTEYYKNTSLIGWNHVNHLFDHKCIVMLQDKHVGNEHDLLNILSSNYIKRADYSNLRMKWIILSNTTLLLNVFGNLQFIHFNDNMNSMMIFSESFVLTLNPCNGTALCTHHLFDV